VFGDPDKGYPIPGIPNGSIFTNCESTDPICRGIPLPLGSHLTYGKFSILSACDLLYKLELTNEILGMDSAKLTEIVTWVKQKTG
jgi:hypothetical protein